MGAGGPWPERVEVERGEFLGTRGRWLGGWLGSAASLGQSSCSPGSLSLCIP